MAKFTLEEVKTDKQRKEFRNMARKIYKGNRNWVHPLDNDIENVFNPTRNKMFDGGEAIRWIARNEEGEVVGRIAAFYNMAQSAEEEQPTGGCGFFEAIDSQQLADMLFDAAKEWLQSKGMEAMDGPVNFGNRDEWWGCLVDGFELQPLYANPYNPPYYQQLFENYGFQNYFNQYTYHRDIKVGAFNPAVYEKVKRLEATPGYRFAHIDKKNLEQVADDFRMIYNKAWANFPGVRPMEREQAQKLMKSLKPIIDEKLIYFAYFNEEPVGFYIMVPDLNRVIGRFHGKMNIINQIRLMLILKFTSKADRVFGIIFGVSPEYSGRGIESGIIYEFENAVRRGDIKGYKTLELAWMGDFNPVMNRMVESYVCARRNKTHITYRYLFDRTKEFKRCPRLTIKRN